MSPPERFAAHAPEAVRAAIVGDAVRAQLTRARAAGPAERSLPGLDRALVGLARAAEDPALARALAGAVATSLRAARASRLLLWRELAEVAPDLRPEARALALEALAAAEARPVRAAERPELRHALALLAELLAADVLPEPWPTFDRVLAAAAAIDDASLASELFAIAGQALGQDDPARILATARRARVHDRPRVLGLLARALPPPLAREASCEALATADAGAAFVVLAPLLPDELLPEALARAEALSPTLHFGATALRALLPRLAARGEATRALALARALPPPSERATALALVAPHLPDVAAREPALAEALALVDALPAAHEHGPGDVLARISAALVPAGWLPLLLDARAARDGKALAAMIAAADPADRAELLPELAAHGGVDELERFPRALPAETLWPRWLGALEHAATRGAAAFLDDEAGDDFAPWCPLAASLAGDPGLAAVAAALREEPR